MVLDCATGRALGGIGWNFYRIWAFPFYTPRGITVLQEFPCDHPFHNGFFVGQHPVKMQDKTGNFWVSPPRRGADDALFSHIGMMQVTSGSEVSTSSIGVETIAGVDGGNARLISIRSVGAKFGHASPRQCSR
jgi:hypothetical protein